MFTIGDAARKMPVPKGAPLKPEVGYASEDNSMGAQAVGHTAQDTSRPSVVVSFRMRTDAHAALLEKAAAAGMTPRSWMEKAVLKLPEPHVVRRKKEHPDLRPLLFQVARAGNNLNQLAHKFNSLDQAGRLRAGDFQHGVEVLRGISAQLHRALARAR